MNGSVRAVIIDQDRILTIERFKPNPDRIFWAFPGGHVEESDKSLSDALKRECEEEIGVEVSIIKKIWQRNSDDFNEIFYLCKIKKGKVKKGNGPEYDKNNNDYQGTHEPKWLNLDQLQKFDLKPEVLRDEIIKNYKNGKNSQTDFKNADWSGLPR